MLSRGDDNEEADDLTDLLAALLEGASSPEGGNRLEVVDELLAVAEDVDSLTSNDLEDLTGTDVSDDVPDGLLETSKTASIKGLGDSLDSISKLKKSTLDGLDAQLLDASLKIRPAGVHVSDDDIDVTGAGRGIAHAGAHTLSNTADESVDVSGGGRNGNLSVVLVDEDAEDLSHILTSAVEVLGLPLSGDVLEQVDELTAVRPDVHDLVPDEGLDLTRLDLSDDLVDGISSLLDTASLEGISELLDTVSKGEKTLHDSLDVEGLDTVSDLLNGIIEVADHSGHILNTGSGIAHDDVETIGNTLEEIHNILLALKLAITLKLLRRSHNET